MDTRERSPRISESTLTAIAIVRRPISILANARGYFADLTLGFDELIGPLSSIFWLAGLDELVDAINDPAIALEDEVRLMRILFLWRPDAECLYLNCFH